MLLCPRCVDPLSETRTDAGTTYACPGCGGRAETASILRGRHGASAVDALWPEAQASAGPEGLHCPACSDGMGRARLVEDEVEGEVAACARCQVVWFDGAGAEAGANRVAAGQGGPSPRSTASPPPPPPPRGMPPPPRATGATDRKPLKAKRLDSDTVELDLEGGDFLGAILGLVSKVNAPERLVRPFLTWALAASFLALWILPTVGDWASTGFGSIGTTHARWVVEWGFVPEAIFRQGGLTFVTSFFLHGGFFHAFFNAFFLLLTGEDLEGRLGRVRFVALLLAATVVGDLFDAASRADRSVPSIGASGGISGLMAYYALALPEVKVGIPFFFFGLRGGGPVVLRWVAPVRWVLGIWVAMQLFGAAFGTGRIGYAAHLGGALAGVVWWLVERNRAAAPAARSAPPAR